MTQANVKIEHHGSIAVSCVSCGKNVVLPTTYSPGDHYVMIPSDAAGWLFRPKKDYEDATISKDGFCSTSCVEKAFVRGRALNRYHELQSSLRMNPPTLPRSGENLLLTVAEFDAADKDYREVETRKRRAEIELTMCAEFGVDWKLLVGERGR